MAIGRLLIAGDVELAVHTVTPVGERFQAELSAAWTAIPPGVRADLQKAGWQVEAAEFVVDAAPELLNAAPRGWPAGMSWQQTDAVHLPQSRKLVIAEKRLSMRGEVVRATRVSGVLRHELGHAYDMAQRIGSAFASASPHFQAAYARDLQQLDAQQRNALSYYLQPGNAGRQETFAEAFAVVLGGGSDVTRQSEFANAFPTVMRQMRSRLRLIPALEVASQTARTPR